MKNKRLKKFKNKQILNKEKQLKDLKENGIIFPDYNPPPQRRSNLSSKLKQLHNTLKLKEESRRRSKTTTKFPTWENRDRYSYRKEI